MGVPSIRVRLATRNGACGFIKVKREGQPERYPTASSEQAWLAEGWGRGRALR